MRDCCASGTERSRVYKVDRPVLHVPTSSPTMQILPPTTFTAKPCGIFVSLPNLTEVYLPLERAEVHADVIDGEYNYVHYVCTVANAHTTVSAIVTVTQHFWQCSSDRAQKAKYVFPVPARAAVCGFEMTTEDGTVIAAVAKEKEQAKREHEAAISQGYTTALVEHVSDDSKLKSAFLAISSLTRP